MFVKVDPKPYSLGGFKEYKRHTKTCVHPQCKPDDSFYGAL